MKVERFELKGAPRTAKAIRVWASEAWSGGDREAIEEIGREVLDGRDAALRRLTAKFDGVDLPASQALRVDPGEARAALKRLEPALRKAMEVTAENVRAVAEAQVEEWERSVELPQGQSVAVREVPVGSAGIYAPGGRASYPSSVLMCAIPAHVAGVERIALVSPPGSDGRPSELVLAATALSRVDDVYAVGGAQAIFALAFGTDSIAPVDVIVGPGNTWVQEAKRAVAGMVGIDSYAGPSELMLIAGHDTDPEWAALDLCAQAEHGRDGTLVVAAVEEHVLDAIATATAEAAARRETVQDAPLALVQVPDLGDAIDLANALAPEHLQLMEEDAAMLADRVTTAGCVFVGRYGATAFGDYVAGSNHVLPTGGAGRAASPLGPGTFRRRISKVTISAGAAAALAPHADAFARAEGFPVHGESAMIRAKESS